MASLYCFGDSITRGENDAERGGWADRLKADAIRTFVERGGEETVVFNLGIGGETTEGLRKRLVPELAARLDPGERSIVLLAYGANDLAETAGRANPNGKVRGGARVRAYNDALRSLAGSERVELLDVHAAFAGADLAALFVPDGIHPNAAGHERIYRLVKNSLPFP